MRLSSNFLMIFFDEGRVKVTIKTPGDYKAKEITNLYPNKYFGEIALIREDCRRTANCISDDPNGTFLMCLHKIQFDALVNEESTHALKAALEDRTELARMGMLLDDGSGSLQAGNKTRKNNTLEPSTSTATLTSMLTVGTLKCVFKLRKNLFIVSLY